MFVGGADDLACGDAALDLWGRRFSQFIGKTCRHHFVPIATLRLWAARLKLVPEHHENRRP
jgi:hypothetical protein